MESIVEKLKKYFETTSHEQVLKDWEATKEFDEIGPTVDHFLCYTLLYSEIRMDTPQSLGHCPIISNYNPKYPSGFFINKYVTLCN